MYLSHHQTATGPRWALDGRYLPESFRLNMLLELRAADAAKVLAAMPAGEPASDPLLPPIEADQEVWASGVTYLRSREARKVESTVGDVYQKVYEAVRPELFFKSIGWRAMGTNQPVRIRKDSKWNVPEPELVLVANRYLEIVGFCAGDDVSSRDIEGENPLYLPQAKVYNGSCSIGPGIQLAAAAELKDTPIQLEIRRGGAVAFSGETSTAQMKRELQDLVDYLGSELTLPAGAFLMTGTGLVPPDTFTLQVGDVVKITVGGLTLENEVQS